MSEQFHIIIAGDQRSPRSFMISKKKLLITVSVVSISAVFMFATSFFTAGLFSYNKILVSKMESVKENMKVVQDKNDNFERSLAEVVAEKNKELDDLKIKSDLLISQMKVDSSKKIAELEKKNLVQEASFKQERDLLLSTAVSELNERSEFIENVISNIGIKVKQAKGKSSQKHSGGPYIAAENASYDELLYRTDSYLKTIQSLPLGKPVKGHVTSWFGKRQDPLNNKNAFHEGIDFRGKSGDPIIATAGGKVVYAGPNGGFGKYVKINHGNGYTTCFAHLLNYHVKVGDYVTRGQVIGLVGNSGRSTGPHLHYEIAYKGKPVNPSKFMKVANLTCSFNMPPEK